MEDFHNLDKIKNKNMELTLQAALHVCENKGKTRDWQII